MPTGIGYTVQVPIRSLDAQDVKDAFAFYYNYQEKVDLGFGVLENNPITKEDFVNSCCTQFMLNIYKNFMIEKAEIDAKNAAVQLADTRSQEVTVWFDTLRNESYPVNPYTNYPTATSGLAFTTNMITPVDVTLEAVDPNNLPLTFEIIDNSAFTKSITDNVVTVNPVEDFYGVTNLSFRAYNGEKYSPTYDHYINVVDTRPVASDMQLVFDMGQSAEELILATDPRDLSLTYSIVDQPSKGSVTLTDNSFEYVPNANEFGEDLFTYKVSNGEVYSPKYTVSVFMNDLRPYADHYAASTTVNNSVDVTITSTDPRSLPVSYVITAQPTNGSASISGSVITYTPSNNYVGTDRVSFVATNGTFSSDVYGFEITVNGE
jgi:hypothetical protein